MDEGTPSDRIDCCWFGRDPASGPDPGGRPQAFSASRTGFDGLNTTFFEAAMVIGAPVVGLRPSRSGRIGT
jgi:hypothetical protein